MFFCFSFSYPSFSFYICTIRVWFYVYTLHNCTHKCIPFYMPSESEIVILTGLKSFIKACMLIVNTCVILNCNTDSKLPLSFRALTLSVLAPTSHRSFSRELRTDDRFRRPPDEDDEEEVSFRMGSCRTILNPQHRLGITFSLNSFVVRVYRRGFIALFIGMTKIISQAYVSWLIL